MTAMIDLALHQPAKGSVTLKSIASHQQLSMPYLEQLFAKLKAQGLVCGMRGRAGGYRLMRSAEDISIYQIINAVDESVDVTRCDGRQDCQEGEVCLTHELWSTLSKRMSGFLDEIKLADLVQSPRVQAIAQRQQERSQLNCDEQRVSFAAQNAH